MDTVEVKCVNGTILDIFISAFLSKSLTKTFRQVLFIYGIISALVLFTVYKEQKVSPFDTLVALGGLPIVFVILMFIYLCIKIQFLKNYKIILSAGKLFLKKGNITSGLGNVRIIYRSNYSLEFISSDNLFKSVFLFADDFILLEFIQKLKKHNFEITDYGSL